jgi:hypothetical protein
MPQSINPDPTISGEMTPGVGTIYLDPRNFTVQTVNRPLMAGPIPRDPRLPLDHPDQTFTDCRSIEGWTDTIKRLMEAAWGFKDSNDSFQFSHSYGLLPDNPTDMKGVIIVYEILSMVPGTRGKTGVERKALLREVVPRQTVTQVDENNEVVLQQSADNGRTWVWAQRFDAVVRFMIYGDTWERAIEYTDKTFDLIQTYTSIFRQAGLAKLFFRMQGQDILHDPPRVQEFPNRCLMYDVTIEKQTVVTYSQIQQILVTAGITSIDGGPNQVVSAFTEGTMQSTVLPSSNEPGP